MSAMRNILENMLAALTILAIAVFGLVAVVLLTPVGWIGITLLGVYFIMKAFLG